MSLNRPSLQELIQRVAADIQARWPGADALLRRSNLSVLARIIAAVAHGLYGYIDNLARQVIPDTADTEFLERWASVWGLTRTASTGATGNVTFTGTDGVLIPAGTVLQRSDGQQYQTQAPGTIAAGIALIAVLGTTPGANSAAVAGSALVLTTPIAGVNSTALVAAPGLTGASDVESDAGLRARLLYRIQRPPQGGSKSDYENWCFEVAGVTRVWVKPLYSGVGTVGIFFVRDNDGGGIIPDAGEVATLQAYIDARRPVTAQVTVFAPTTVAVNFTIAVTPNTAAVKAAVQAELADVIRREAQPGGTIYLSHLREAVSIAAGEDNHVMTVPAADIVAGAGAMHVMGVITWV